MPRPTMAAAIAHLRLITSASEFDEFNGETFWSDDQLQDVLDQNSLPLLRQKMQSAPVYVDGSLTYVNQFLALSSRGAWFEDNAAARDEQGYELTGTFNPNTRFFVLDDDPGDVAVYFSGLLLDMNAAAAQVWETKAAQRHDYIQVKALQNSLHMQQEYDHCVQMAQMFRNRKVRGVKRK